MELTIEQALEQGVTAHREGKLEEADRLYRAILQSQPAHPDANHNLGVLAVSVNKADAALPLFKSALEANPKIEQFWLSYIDALIKEKQFDNAKEVFGQAKKQGVAGEKLNVLETQLISIIHTDNIGSVSPSKKQLSSLLEHYQNERFNDAEKLASSITQKFPKHQFGWKVLGAVLKKTGRVSESLVAIQKSVQLVPQDSEAHYNLGITLTELGRLNEAEVSYTQAIALKPDYAGAYNNLGNTLKELGRLEEAEASYKQAISMKPDYAAANCNLGIMLTESGRLDEAEASYRQAIALKPDYAEANYNLGIMLTESGKLDEAEAIYRQAIALKPDYAEAHSNLGNTLNKLGKLKESEASYTQAIALKPDYAEAHNNLGATLHELGRLDEAETNYTQAIALEPDYAEAHNNLGATLHELGRLEEAEANYTQAIALKPDYAEAHNNLGATLQELGRLDETEASLRQALALKPDYAEAYSNLGNSLNELGRFDEAEASYTQAMVLKPDLADAHCNLGFTLRELGRFDEAKASLMQAIMIKSDYTLAHINLARVLYNMGYKNLALESIEKANHIDPQSKEAMLILSVIKSRKSREESEAVISDVSNVSAFRRLTSNIVILNRAVDEALISYIYGMSSRALDKTKDARYGSGTCSSDFNLFEDSGSIIQKTAEDLTRIMMEAVKSDVYIYDSFFNILGAGGGSTPHKHINNLDKDIGLNLAKQKFSLVYYLSVGDQNCSEPGILKLYDPVEDILPCKGMITIIPSNRMHSAAYSGTTDRIMIGVNFYSL